MESTIDTACYCSICGSIITSQASIARGYGGECATAVKKARLKRIFDDAELKRKYYAIEAEMIIAELAKMNFRSEFRKSFSASVMAQKDWLSRKQKEIALSLLGNPSDLLDTITRRREIFLDEIPVTQVDIEVARREIREKRGIE